MPIIALGHRDTIASSWAAKQPSQPDSPALTGLTAVRMPYRALGSVARRHTPISPLNPFDRSHRGGGNGFFKKIEKQRFEALQQRLGFGQVLQKKASHIKGFKDLQRLQRLKITNFDPGAVEDIVPESKFR